ncbi:hypothetical protein GGX14DRAFT_446316, partial [Mycena pura]
MKITELVVRSGDCNLLLAADGPTYWFHTEHERIEERGWGCLDPESPISGLCTDLVATCIVFVFQCRATRRTTLCHVVSKTDIAVFEEQMRYVTKEDPHSQVDIVVFQGCVYGNTGEVPSKILQEDSMWVSQTLEHIRNKRTSCHASAYPKPLGYGVVLVDKLSGDVIIPMPPTTEPAPQFLSCINTWPPTPTMLIERQIVDEFYRIQSTASYIRSKYRIIPCFQVYDGTRKLVIPPSSDDTREIFRIATMHPNFPHFEHIQQSDLDICNRVVPTIEMPGYIKHLPELIRKAGGFCEVAGCRKFTIQTCSMCKGAHYCNKNHQEEHWAEHKTWCKSHRYKPGG